MVECVLGGGLHNHFQLSCIFDDLLCQLGRGDGHLFCPLLLTGERVIAIWAQTPSSLNWKKAFHFGYLVFLFFVGSGNELCLAL